MPGQPLSKSTSPLEGDDLGRDMERFEGNARTQGQAQGIYANVAPKLPVAPQLPGKCRRVVRRSQSLTLGTPPPRATLRSEGANVSPASGDTRSPAELAAAAADKYYTAITYETMEPPSIYEVPGSVHQPQS